ISRLENSVIKEVVVCNSIKLEEDKINGTDKITVLSIAPLIGDAIIRIHEEESVSTLFDK
ncbi:MAG: ribose-phosphate pyrophosphokinase, partial [Tumebacillaceae bacterium]